MNARFVFAVLSIVGMLLPSHIIAALGIVDEVDWQPFAAQVRRVLDTLEAVGEPVPDNDRQALQSLLTRSDASPEAVQQILDKYCLAGVQINPESRVKVAAGDAKRELVEQGWRTFLVKVQNQAGVTAVLQAISPNARSSFEGGAFSTPSDRYFKKRGESLPNSDLWFEVEMFDTQPMQRNLSGLKLEYRVIQLFSRDAGKREAKLMFNVGQGTQDLGFRNEIDFLFQALPARQVTLLVRDEKGEATTAAFVIKDHAGRVYPAQAKRLAPDFGFHPQVYRADGETVKLPDGNYTFEFSRGPESIASRRTVKVSASTHKEEFKVERWIDPSKLGWWSGDHHIHAAGCAHYTKPTEGVHAVDMMRHCLGEDLKVGANLTWGPCFDYQKQFFTGAIDKVSQYPYLLRYDVEVSGFGSHQSGHLCLLRLKDQMYPGGDSDKHWPTLCLNTLKWAKAQGALVGPAHSGWGLQVETTDLPNYIVPPFDGIGANEYIVDVTHMIPGPNGALVPAVDFLSMVDTPYVWELNMWYNTLNVGFRTRISGETDFPCIYGERVGLGRSYVKLDGKLDYNSWCEGIRAGRNYVSDGKSHIFDFKANDVLMGQNGSELKLREAGTVRVSAQVAAWLPEKARPEIKKRPYSEQPYWDIERGRIDGTREVRVEAIVNGYAVTNQVIQADGSLRDLEFNLPIKKSSWVALRILPSSHTNPIFVVVDGKPIRASRRSAEWCLKGVEKCWSQKQRHIAEKEKGDARAAYDSARDVYKTLLAESQGE